MKTNLTPWRAFLACFGLVLTGACTADRSANQLPDVAEKPAAIQTKATPAENPSGIKTAQTEASRRPVPDLPVVGYLEFRNQTVTMQAAPDGARYTITTKEGKVLAQQLKVEELQAQYPDLYKTIKTGRAGNDASIGSAIR